MTSVSNHGPRMQLATHRPPSSFETPVVAARRQAPQDEGGAVTCRAAIWGSGAFLDASCLRLGYCGKALRVNGRPERPIGAPAGSGSITNEISLRHSR